jgi:cobalt-zinc-cadmium resistance protein CzcA
VIGGLVTATFLTLFVLPLLYLLFSTGSHAKGKVKSVTIVIIALFCFGTANAQTDSIKTIGLDDAIATAMQNNLAIQSQALNVQSSSTLKKSTFELPKTNVNFQYGQYNSINQDRAFQITQTIPFPTYFTSRSNLYSAELQEVSYDKKQQKMK